MQALDSSRHIQKAQLRCLTTPTSAERSIYSVGPVTLLGKLGWMYVLGQLVVSTSLTVFAFLSPSSIWAVRDAVINAFCTIPFSLLPEEFKWISIAAFMLFSPLPVPLVCTVWSLFDAHRQDRADALQLKRLLLDGRCLREVDHLTRAAKLRNIEPVVRAAFAASLVLLSCAAIYYSKLEKQQHVPMKHDKYHCGDWMNYGH